jgi:hypothetical protein
MKVRHKFLEAVIGRALGDAIAEGAARPYQERGQVSLDRKGRSAAAS